MMVHRLARRRGGIGVRQWAGAAAGAALLVSCVVLPAPATAAPPPACSDTAFSDAAAESLARGCQRPVEILSQRTESADILANPDGTRTLRTYVQPQRVRRGDGTWAPIDPTLRREADGSLAPIASTAGVRFSGGGSGPLVTMSENGATMALSWPRKLPAPVVSGMSATYPEVLPGVDLRLTAEVDGFSQVLIVKDRAAAANPALRRIGLRQSTTGATLRTTANGIIEARDAKGAVAFASSGAFVWDSPTPAAIDAKRQARARNSVGTVGTEGGVEPEPAAPAHYSAMPVEVTGSEIAVTPPAALLTGADTQFPLYIDPAFSGTAYKWTQVNSGSPDTSYWTRNRDYMRVGHEWDNSNVWRTFLRFDNLHPLFGQRIISASVFVTLWHSASCSASPVTLWSTKFVDDVYTNSWNLTTGHWVGALQTVNANANKDACPQPNAVIEYGNGNVVNQLQALTNNSTWHIDLGLRAANEGDRFQWKKFLPSGAHLDVVYNLSPNAPVLQNLSSVTDCYRQCGNGATVRTTTPTLAAAVSDPNGGQMITHFWVQDAAETTVLASGAVAGVSGSTATWKVPAGVLSNGGTYHWRAIAQDELAYQTFSGSWAFTVDTSPPATPTVTSTQYPAKTWAGAPNTPGTFALASTSTDTFDFTWSVDNGPATTVPAAGTTTRTAAANYTPTTDMVHTLRVTARDAAGNSTSTFDHQFWVSPVANRFSHWTFDETSGITAADSGTGGSSRAPVTLSGAVTFGPGYPIPGGTGNGAIFTGGAITAGGPILDTTKSFTVMAWVRPSEISATNGFMNVISQDGVNMSKFMLRYDKDANGGAGGWCFNMRPTDASGTQPVAVCATGTVGSSHLPVAGEWVHLAGVYDAATRTIQIHVMGNQQSCDGEMVTAPFTSTWTATGPLAIGRGFLSGATMHWRGAIDDVYAYQRKLDPVEICQQANQ
jgi:hypothetical protein